MFTLVGRNYNSNYNFLIRFLKLLRYNRKKNICIRLETIQKAVGTGSVCKDRAAPASNSSCSTPLWHARRNPLRSFFSECPPSVRPIKFAYGAHAPSKTDTLLVRFFFFHEPPFIMPERLHQPSETQLPFIYF